MSNITRQQQADLAADAYNTRPVTKPNDKPIFIEGNYYKVLAVHKQPFDRLPRNGVPRCPNRRNHRCPQRNGISDNRLV